MHIVYVEEVLRAILPDELTEVPSAYTAVGHIGMLSTWIRNTELNMSILTSVTSFYLSTHESAGRILAMETYNWGGHFGCKFRG